MPSFRSGFTQDEIENEFEDAQELAHAQDSRIWPLPTGLDDTVYNDSSYSSYLARRDDLRDAEYQGHRKDKYLTNAELGARAARKARAKVPTAPVQASEEERAKRHQRLHERGGRCFICAGLELVDG